MIIEQRRNEIRQPDDDRQNHAGDQNDAQGAADRLIRNRRDARTQSRLAKVVALDGCLLEIGVICVKYDGVRFPERIPEYLLMNGIPKLTLLRKTFDRAIVFDIIIDLEMRGFIHFKFEVLIPHFILTEILCFCILAKKQCGNNTKYNDEISFEQRDGCVLFIHIVFYKDTC